MNVNRIDLCKIMSTSTGPDDEHKRIMRRLMSYGIMPTGNKSSDKNMLYEIEIKLAKQESCVSNKFLTVSVREQEEIQEKKKEKRVEANPELYTDTDKVQRILAEQKVIEMIMKGNFNG